MSQVTLINPFEVPADQEAVFLESWRHATEFLRRQRGFLSSELHRSRDPKARFRFTNITTWESSEHFTSAIHQPEFVELMDRMSFSHYPALYDLFLHWRRDDQPWRKPFPSRPRRRPFLAAREAAASAPTP